MGNEKQKGKAFALLPIGVFLVIFLGAGILFKDFLRNAGSSCISDCFICCVFAEP